MTDNNNTQPTHVELLTLTTDIVAAYLSESEVPVDAIPTVIEKVYKTLQNINAAPTHMSERPQPAVPIKKSVNADYIVCLEDGKKLKMLKRHLKTAYNMTPEEYRERWGLSADYPMVAPNYAEKRSSLAKSIGLGKTRVASRGTKGTSKKLSAVK